MTNQDKDYEKYQVYKKIPLEDRFWYMMKRFDEIEKLLEKDK